MENRYYQPDISEFHVGFEFESKYVLFNDRRIDGPSSEHWKKVTLSQLDHEWFFNAYVNDAHESEFRVKYLDREDIESLGWEYTGVVSYFEKSVYSLDNTMHPTKIFIKTLSGMTLFSGTIKNKSELKKLLKQLGI